MSERKMCFVCGILRPRKDWQELGWSAVQMWKPIKGYWAFCPKHADEDSAKMIIDKLTKK